MAIHYVDYIGDLKALIDCREMVDFYGFERNVNDYIYCPFHSEKTPSMKVYKDHYKCFGCGDYGDAISFVQKYLHTDFEGAMNRLNADFSLNLPFEDKSDWQAIRELRKAQAELKRHKNKKDRIKKQRSDLEDLWRMCDNVILQHPAPDTVLTAKAYSMRDYIQHLILNFNDEEGYDDDVIQHIRL